MSRVLPVARRAHTMTSLWVYSDSIVVNVETAYTRTPSQGSLPATTDMLDEAKGDISSTSSVLDELGFQIPEEILGIIRSLYAKPQFYVDIEGVKSKVATQETGIRQGCPLSPYLFTMVMDRIFEIIPQIAQGHKNKMRIQKKRQEGVVKSFAALLYADDTLLCDNTEKETQALLWAVEEVSGIFGLKLNKKKCLVIAVEERIAGQHIKIKFLDGTILPEESQAEYLGGILDSKANPKAEIAKRISVAGQCRFQMGNFWRKAKLDTK